MINLICLEGNSGEIKMAVTNKIIYCGEEWEYVFFKTDGILNPEDREHFIWNAIDMGVKEIDKRTLKGKNYEGQLVIKGRSFLGSFVGTEFNASIETERGRGNLSGLMLDGVRAGNN